VKIIILGLGNPLWGDDSAGSRVVHVLRDRIPQMEITLAEASIAGLDILEILADYDKAIIIDAIKTKDGIPGTIYRFEIEDITTSYDACPHDLDFIAALELGKQLGLFLPESITIFAIEAEQTTFSQEGCTPKVNVAIPICADMIMHDLQIKAGQISPV
jgi:hydrogenase maturation protease